MFSVKTRSPRTILSLKMFYATGIFKSFSCRESVWNWVVQHEGSSTWFSILLIVVRRDIVSGFISHWRGTWFNFAGTLATCGLRLIYRSLYWIWVMTNRDTPQHGATQATGGRIFPGSWWESDVVHSQGREIQKMCGWVVTLCMLQVLRCEVAGGSS